MHSVTTQERLYWRKTLLGFFSGFVEGNALTDGTFQPERVVTLLFMKI